MESEKEDHQSCGIFGDLSEDVKILICLRLNNRISTRLDKKIRDKYFRDHNVYIDLDNYYPDLSFGDIGLMEKYGLSINLGDLKYHSNTGDFRDRTISKNCLLSKLFITFMNIINEVEFLKNIPRLVKFVRSDSVIMPDAFVLAFPNAKFCGPIGYTDENIEFMKDRTKNGGIYYSKSESIEVNSLAYTDYKMDLTRLIRYKTRINIANIKRGDYLPALEEIYVEREYIDKMLEFNLDLPRLRILHFSSWLKDYDSVEKILEKYPTILRIRNFILKKPKHLDFYKKYHGIIKKNPCINRFIRFCIK